MVVNSINNSSSSAVKTKRSSASSPLSVNRPKNPVSPSSQSAIYSTAVGIGSYGTISGSYTNSNSNSISNSSIIHNKGSSRPPSPAVSISNNQNFSNIRNDPKLLHLVKKIVQSSHNNPNTATNNNNKGNNNSNHYKTSTDNSSQIVSPITSATNSRLVTEILLNRHREYRRKNGEALQKSVENILNTIRNQSEDLTKAANNTHNPSSKSHLNSITAGNNHLSKGTATKRKRDINDSLCETNNNGIGGNKTKLKRQPSSPSLVQKEESEYEKEAAIHDSKKQSLLHSQAYNHIGTSMLNAGLRNRYKDVQRERDILARKQLKQQQELEKKDQKNNEDAATGQSANNNGNTNNDTLLPQKDDTLTPNDDPEYSSISSPSLQSPHLPPTIPENGTSTDHNISKEFKPQMTTQSQPSSTKKKKKKMTRSTSSNSLQNDQRNNDANFPFQTSSSNLTSPSPRPKERYSDLGGMSTILSQIRQLIEYPLAHPELFTHLGIDPPRGVLLRGPPGCGKTHLANAIAGQLNIAYFRISAPEIVSSMSGESEQRLRDLFQSASSSAPAIIFIDEIDAIAPKRGDGGSSSGGGGGSKGMEKRIVAQLLTCLDSIAPQNNRDHKAVMVLGATNRPDSIDPALRRAGRFDREILLGVPDESARLGILQVMTGEMRLSGDMNLKLLARKTPGFVGADIRSLTKEAGVIAINRIFKSILSPSILDSSDQDNNDKEYNPSSNHEIKIDATSSVSNNNEETESTTLNNNSNDSPIKALPSDDIQSITPFTQTQLEPLFVNMSDFLAAIPHVQPSSKREGFATIPDVSWDNIGALQSIREELSLSVLEPIRNPEKFEKLGIPLPAGVLLYGPPGCGKTLLAKAIASESGANFISVKGPELLDKYVGESERSVRIVFERARSSSPCIVFFDELDSLCPKRGSDSNSGGGGVSERVVNQLLTEMDGLESRRSVFVIAATNRPELIDPAMLRPGRLDKLMYVPLPSPDDRVSILKTLSANVNLALDVDLDAIARNPRSNGYSGADCAALLREAGLAVLRESSKSYLSKNDNEDAEVEADHNQRQNMETGGVEDSDGIKDTQVLQILRRHFDSAFDYVMPSVSKKDEARYSKIRNRMARARTRGGLIDNESDTNRQNDGKEEAIKI
mmetsp:Transcript_3097/g.4360  ORF Transcript_3097/g.4360 Transcript_3097/m.4360 type:complete len:1145 (+) Transcript_3097:240-3674(+)|eukprot:CAMPEP_0184866600 /NCGR_PEP_ID=MMETSP0580-20130426/22906_1 /TAXON_ID=1118495 /ORGANISM="Dactyliosolen fragilissimus" /LENGTH=1144 /DNA_ID=CAMNT_0027366357 /DNA_START=177 /DNA_END=3611 /DNA_ORIENTATION=+